MNDVIASIIVAIKGSGCPLKNRFPQGQNSLEPANFLILRTT